jgi:alkylated DNA repair dioxygenase AlkB
MTSIRFGTVSIYSVLAMQVIASVSLGAVRTFIMSPKATNKKDDPDKGSTTRWDLANGSLFVMQGDTQKNWKVGSFPAVGATLSN